MMPLLHLSCVFGRNVTLNLSGSKGLKVVQRLDDKDAFAISKCLENNRQITGEETECVKAANTFPVTSKLFFYTTGLDVSYNNITDEGVRHLADLLQVGMYMWMIYSHLRVWTWRESDPLNHLIFTEQDDSTLNSLDLRFNDFQTDGAIAIAKILQVAPSNTNKDLIFV